MIRLQSLDRRHGFDLELVLGGDLGDRRAQATQHVLAQGRADLIDTDWLSIARSQDTDAPLHAIFPYGKIVGALVVATGSGIEGLDELRGRRVGVIRASDKNWFVARAACRQRHGFDPQGIVQLAEALSKTTLLSWLESGEVEVAALPWHLAPRVTASGKFRQLCDVLDLLPELGAPSVPTTFFATRPEFAATHPKLVAAFIAAYRDAVAMMRADETLWREAAAQPGDDAVVLAGLRAAWLRRICDAWPENATSQLNDFFERLSRDSLVPADA
ncbi:NitT/TauT family transport system substrate-binding protein [Rhodoblastus acidophilus]|uniref:ABC transporter substrate-binding protein n=1 Tax=Rhodoblastus acidophilus TaxID=1074 RepID=UPI002224EE70|nr:ABC transporter substrate-binding protein [Rhodoblastus acidophilus]MCW2284115.1 NitT/TauT family transport system substrate-binding protein [Rhodoblastus acidophilus]MCW2332811.1 NitT/TauT family transport system substrate-binding protein [Rhodoblastus acidophilus]